MQNANKGIKIKKYINVEDSVELLVIAKNVVYSAEDLEEYREKFETLIKEGKLFKTSFEENVWKSADNNGNVNFEFDLFSTENINIILKCYVITKMSDGEVVASQAKRNLRIAKKHLLATNFLNPEKVDLFMKSIKSFSEQEKIELVSFREFLLFADIDNSAEYIEILDGVSIPRGKYRQLPNYQSILMFDVILSTYIAQADTLKQEEYLPLLLWWKITSILPLRPIEFSILKADCCYFDSTQNCYFLTVERRKRKNGKLKVKTIPLINEIKVTKEIFDLIQKYKSLTSNTDSEFLLAKSFYKKFLKLDRLVAPEDDEEITTAQLRTLLRRFYSEIITEEFNYEVIEKTISTEDYSQLKIQRMQLGDTRHIAMCGLLLQGFNPLTIAKLAGHDSLRDQMKYFDHMQSYIEASVYVLAKNLKLEFNTNYVDLEFQKTWKKNVVDRNILDDEFTSLRQVEGGKCISKNFPFECTLDSCLFCKDHFIHDNSLSPKLLEKYINIKNNNIKTKITCIQNIMKSMKALDDESYDIDHQKMLKTENNQLKALINQRGLLEAYKLTFEGVSNE